MKTVFFKGENKAYLLEAGLDLSEADLARISWALRAEQCSELNGTFVGPRRELISPWSTCACEIFRSMGVRSVDRVECFEEAGAEFDPMLQERYEGLDADSLKIQGQPEAVRFISDIDAFNAEAGLALSTEEIAYLNEASRGLARPLTDSEVFGFAQINSEHCRHKIFNGQFVVDGKVKESSLFSLIKETAKNAPERLVSAYKDNVAFVRGPKLQQFSARGGAYETEEVSSVISLKAETHNFPTTVEPFYGASTGSGGEIRDRMAGGKGSMPLAGTAVYMTSYPRLGTFETSLPARNWKYQSPLEILIKASNGASDFGNKFGQPLITGSLFTFEAETSRATYAYDRCIMLAGGVGYGLADLALKDSPEIGDVLVLLGGDNYRIGMAGGSVSSVDTGAYASEKERSAVQRANPEMQKRVYNVIRALSESSDTPVTMIHDHGAGGHINCFSELLEELGGVVSLPKLPVGDRTLSVKEIICNESQERMGLILPKASLAKLKDYAARERAPWYVVGEVTGNKRIVFEAEDGSKPVDVPVDLLFADTPNTSLEDSSIALESSADPEPALKFLEKVLSLEAVACKDWLTNKVDRSVGGLVAKQQCCGPLQLPLSNVGVSALDYFGKEGVAQALGHASAVGVIDESAGSRLSVAEALTNLVWAPLKDGLGSVALSANWMWPAKRAGENARLYAAVEALSRVCIELDIAVPTGKDSLSMTMNYDDGQEVRAPGTVVVTAVAHCDDINKVVTPDLKPLEGSKLVYLDFSGQDGSPLGGSSLAQVQNVLGAEVPDLQSIEHFKNAFAQVQKLVREDKILAGHDISSGGLIGAVCEMGFAGDIGVRLHISDPARLFSEKPGVVLQVEDDLGVGEVVGEVGGSEIRVGAETFSLKELRDVWFRPSFLFDSEQTKKDKAKERFKSYSQTPLRYQFPKEFNGHLPEVRRGPQAAILRDKGTNGDRELAFCLYAAGFNVRDITMYDLLEGEEDLKDISFLAFPGGFTNSDVLGAARGWAGSILFNSKAKSALESFFEREDTLSLGVCNGCQLMSYLDIMGLPYSMADNESGKFESSFCSVRVEETNSVMLKPLIGSELGIWVAHGEGKFLLPETGYDLPLKYSFSSYPANPNGSDQDAAAICSLDGRHLAMMPHLERAALPWQWPYLEEKSWEITPWMLAFLAAREWVA